MKPEVIRLCTRKAILKDIHKDQMQGARTSWSLPTLVGGQYELESEQSMNTHQPESKLPIPQNIIANLGTHLLKVPQKSWRIRLDGLYTRPGLAVYIFQECFPKDVAAHSGLSPPTSINPQENPPQVSLSREVPQLRLSSQEILGCTELMVRVA